MAKKVLTEEDFQEGKKAEEEDTSKSTPEPDEIIEGKEKEEEPEKEAKPSKGEEEPEPSEEKTKFKHKTWDETEKARLELERGFHEKSTRLAEAERRIAQFEKPPEKPVTIDDRIRGMTKETINKIRLLPVESLDRDEDAGFLWAKLQSDITDLKYEERAKKVDAERDVVKRTYDRATKEGIKTDAELRILGYEFSKTDSNLSTDERITQSIDSTKEVLTQIREGLVEKQERDKKEKEDLKVLGRGSSRREKSEEKKDEPTSMSQQLAELNEKRRIKKDDLRY